MMTSLPNFIKRPVVTGIAFLAFTFQSKTQAQNQPLPVVTKGTAAQPTQQTVVPVFRQPINTTQVRISGAISNGSNLNVPRFVQPFTDTHQPLTFGGQEPIQQKTVVPAASTTLSGSGIKLSVAGAPTVVPTETPTTSTLMPGVPVGTPDHYAVYTDKVLTVAAPGFLANDIDLNGEALTATAILDNVDHGSLAAFGDGSFTYTPASGFTGTDAFVYRMRDASNNFADPVTVTIEVLPPANRNPVGGPDTYGVLAQTALSVAAPGFLANDIDPDGEAITATAILDNVDHGTLAAFGNGSFTYTPTPGYTGPDAFVYRMRDASNNFGDPVTVTLNVYPANRAPIGVDDDYAAVINTSLSVAAPGFLGNDMDLDGEAITATAILDNVDHGILAAFGNGSFTYTPAPGFTGTDAFVYRMRDASNNFGDPVTVTIQVLAAGTTPVGSPDHYAVAGDMVLSIAAPGFLANDIDLNGEALTATAILDNVDHGILAAFGNGSFTYTPSAGFTGTDAFVYRMRDASNNFGDPVTVTIDVLPPANRAPIGGPDEYGVISGTALSVAAPGFLANDIDPDGEAITATAILDNVDHGTLAAFGNGSFTYTPTPGYTGPDAFVYRMRDASNNFGEPVTVTLNVVEGNRPPMGVDDEYTAVINTPLGIAAPGFLSNDVDPDGDALTATAILDNVDHGALAAFGNGSFTYTPNTDFVGTDEFVYRMRDAKGNFADAVTVTIHVVTPNRPPVANAGSDQTAECDGSGGTQVALDGGGSSDPDNDALTYTWRENGSIIAGPTTASQVTVFLALGVHTIELTVTDDIGQTGTDEVMVTVADNAPPAVAAAFIPKPGDKKVFTISCSVSDDCDGSVTTNSMIVLPQLTNPEIQLQVKKSQKLKIDLKENKVLVQAPDPQTFWNGIMALGGVPVTSGQELTVEWSNKEFSFIFDDYGQLQSVAGPMVVLRCTATDGSGNTAVSEATAPMNGNDQTAYRPITNNVMETGEPGLEQNFPNPFANSTVIRFTLADAGPVRLAVYDDAGQLVKTLVNKVMPQGQHQVTWNAENLPAGSYYYRIYTDGFVQTRKMVLLR